MAAVDVRQKRVSLPIAAEGSRRKRVRKPDPPLGSRREGDPIFRDRGGPTAQCGNVLRWPPDHRRRHRRTGSLLDCGGQETNFTAPTARSIFEILTRTPALGLSMGDLFRLHAAEKAGMRMAAGKKLQARAQSIIQLHLPGGLQQQESFDPRPEATPRSPAPVAPPSEPQRHWDQLVCRSRIRWAFVVPQ